MRRFKEGDILTLEDVKKSFAEIEAECSQILNEAKKSNVRPTIENGCEVFDSFEDMEKYYGGPICTLEEFISNNRAIEDSFNDNR